MSNERVDRIEERLAWLERHVVAQDKAMLELHEELGVIRRESNALRDRLETNTGGDADRPAPSERPPHY